MTSVTKLPIYLRQYIDSQSANWEYSWNICRSSVNHTITRGICLRCRKYFRKKFSPRSFISATRSARRFASRDDPREEQRSFTSAAVVYRVQEEDSSTGSPRTWCCRCRLGAWTPRAFHGAPVNGHGWFKADRRRRRRRRSRRERVERLLGASTGSPPPPPRSSSSLHLMAAIRADSLRGTPGRERRWTLRPLLSQAYTRRFRSRLGCFREACCAWTSSGIVERSVQI